MIKKSRGSHQFICDVDGMAYPSSEKRKRWDGAIVHRDNWEARHPQDLVKAVKEDTSVKDARGEVGQGSDQGSGYTFIPDKAGAIYP
jgi:hypothetical protein